MSVKKHSISEKMAQLDKLLVWFDSEAFELEVALGKFEEAKKLAGEIEKDLETVKNNITVISEQFDREIE